jgi:hypothetical protein
MAAAQGQSMRGASAGPLALMPFHFQGSRLEGAVALIAAFRLFGAVRPPARRARRALEASK